MEENPIHVTLIFGIEHCRHVGGRKQYIFSPLGSISRSIFMQNCFIIPEMNHVWSRAGLSPPFSYLILSRQAPSKLVISRPQCTPPVYNTRQSGYAKKCTLNMQKEVSITGDMKTIQREQSNVCSKKTNVKTHSPNFNIKPLKETQN